MPKMFSQEVRDFILQLLTKDPLRRLGARGASDVKKHEFFKVTLNFCSTNLKLNIYKPIDLEIFEREVYNYRVLPSYIDEQWL